MYSLPLYKANKLNVAKARIRRLGATEYKATYHTWIPVVGIFFACFFCNAVFPHRIRPWPSCVCRLNSSVVSWRVKLEYAKTRLYIYCTPPRSLAGREIAYNETRGAAAIRKHNKHIVISRTAPRQPLFLYKLCCYSRGKLFNAIRGCNPVY